MSNKSVMGVFTQFVNLLIQIAIFFTAYGEGRCMKETFGFSIPGVLGGIVLSLIVSPFVVFGCIALLRCAFRISLVMALMCAVMGIALAETWISLDERNFKLEVSIKRNFPIFRHRRWPFHGYDIYYAEDRGFWSTD